MPNSRRGPPKTINDDPVRAYRVNEALGAAVLRERVVAAADFKAKCLFLMDEVRDKGVEFVITKHKRPVARLVPILEEAESKFLGRGRGIIAVIGDIVTPTAPDWEEGADT